MRVINHTRYNTEDLEAIIRYVETNYLAHANWRSTEMRFTDFRPAAHKAEQPVYFSRGPAVRKRRYINAPRWNSQGRVGLLAADLLFTNPLQLLADENPQAPREMVEALVHALIRYRGDNAMQSLQVGDLRLRVMAKPETKKPRGPQRTTAERKMYGLRHMRGIMWEAHRAMNSLVASKNKDLTKARFHLKEHRQKLDEVERALEKAIADLAALEAFITTTNTNIGA